MRQRTLALIASVSLFLTCCAGGWGYAEEASLAPQPVAKSAKFEDTAIATLNPKNDAAAQVAAVPESSAGTATATLPKDPPAATEAQPSAGTAGDASAATAADRKSRLAELKARLHERAGGDADPPAEEPPLPLPSGPMWGLRQPQALQNMGASLSGWVQQGITLNNTNAASRFNGPVDMNDRDGEYQLNQLWMTLDRPVHTGGDGFDLGGRVDASYGTDWRWNINNGLENRIDGFDGQAYGLMLPQFYAEAGYNDLTVKLGHFESGFDYESLPGPANNFYSHSYCYTYGVPHLLTGMLADYRVDGNWSVQGGFHRGWSDFGGDDHALGALGGFRWQSSDQKTIVSYAVTNGPQDAASNGNCFVYSLVVQEQLGPRSQYVLVHDLGVENNALPGGGTADWYGLNQYYNYRLSSEWDACVRTEWFRDQDGAAVEGPGNIPGVRAWAGHGFAGNFYEMTAGLNWRPQANLIFRPEVRYDWYDAGAGEYGPGNEPGLPFNDGHSSSQFLTAADLILLF